jgi:hypothetical protein
VLFFIFVILNLENPQFLLVLKCLNLANEFEGPDGPFEKKNARGLWHSVIYK